MTRAYVLHADLRTPDSPEPGPALEEALSLTRAIDLDCAGGTVVPLPRPHPGMLFGSGKVAELKALLEAEKIDLVIVNGPLSPVQQRNLEREWKVKILDRTGLILEIFGERAQTREGVLQVELAHLSYQKTRLVRSWTHLERQRGGLGFVGGPGETQIEADRRMIDERITRIRRQLAKVVKTRSLHRAARKKVPYPIVALVGYTNAGKSTLFNRLTTAEVLAEDMLFATLDPTMRQITLPSGRMAIISDTVGFISDLPTQLVAAFRATLEEVLEADLILHVRDISHPASKEQAAEVHAVLDDLGVASDRREGMVEVLNKIDRLSHEDADVIRRQAERNPAQIVTSAVTGAGTDRLLDEIEMRLFPRRLKVEVHLEHDAGRAASWLYRHAEVLHREDDAEGTRIEAEMTEREFFQFRKLFGDRVSVRSRDNLAAQ